MRVPIRIYRVHDYDLYRLYFTKSFNLYAAIRRALKYYATGYYGKIIPEQIDPLPSKKDEIRISYQFSLLLNSKKDADAIRLLKKVDQRKRNAFIKNVLRRYLCNVDGAFWFEDSGFDPDTKIKKSYGIQIYKEYKEEKDEKPARRKKDKNPSDTDEILTSNEIFEEKIEKNASEPEKNSKNAHIKDDINKMPDEGEGDSLLDSDTGLFEDEESEDIFTDAENSASDNSDDDIFSMLDKTVI